MQPRNVHRLPVFNCFISCYGNTYLLFSAGLKPAYSVLNRHPRCRALVPVAHRKYPASHNSFTNVPSLNSTNLGTYLRNRISVTLEWPPSNLLPPYPQLKLAMMAFPWYCGNPQCHRQMGVSRSACTRLGHLHRFTTNMIQNENDS